MKYSITNSFIFSLLVLSSTTYGHAESASQLPKSIQTTVEEKAESDGITKIDKVEIVPEITIDTSSSIAKVDSQLKEGIACDDEELEPAILGPDMVELPMAQTEPCSTVNCENLEHAVLHKDNYKKIPMAKIIEGCD